MSYDPARVGRYVLLDARAVFGSPGCDGSSPGGPHLLDLAGDDPGRCLWCGTEVVRMVDGAPPFEEVPLFRPGSNEAPAARLGVERRDGPFVETWDA